MIGVAVIAVFACALFLVPSVSAQKIKIVDAWVDPPEGELKDGFNYYVNVTCVHWLRCFGKYEVKLTYGPNYDNPDCNKSLTKSFSFPLDEKNITIPFENIHLRQLKSCDDEFKNFTRGEWDKCWYIFSVDDDPPFKALYKEGPIIIIPIPPPEIKAYLNEKVLSGNNKIYLEEDTNLTFKAKIIDYVEANASLELDVYKNNESYWNCTWNNRTIEVTPDVQFERECDIPFKKERNNFTLNLSYSRLNEINKTFYKTYNLEIIPVSVKFENASVDPEVGYWDDKFNYSIWVTASIALDITLSIYDPCREPEPWIPLGEPDNPYTKKDVNRPKKLNWTNEKPFEKYCTGKSKFYFGYLDKETLVFYGPELKEEITVFVGPELVARFRNPQIKPEDISYNDTFNYCIDVIGSRNLNVTLKYYNGRGWVNASKTEPTKYYTPNGWETLSWQCIANETWEKVMMEVEVEGEKKPIKVY